MQATMLLVLVALVGCLGCSSTEFGARAGQLGGKGADDGKKGGKDDADAKNSGTDGSDADGDGDGDGDDNGSSDNNGGDDVEVGDAGESLDGGDEPLFTEEERDVRKSQCWFAVSGAYLGTTYYPSKFPGTKSGKPIGSGETFDEVGGVYLLARKEPYVYDEGDKALNPPVDWSFDSIAIAPGMKAEIKDAAGTVLYSGSGPAFMLSSDYGNHGAWVGAVRDYEANVAIYPDWMQKILRDTGFRPERTPLHAARSVKVTKIPGKRCDFD